MTWNRWCHDAVTQSRFVWVFRVLTHVQPHPLHPRAHTHPCARHGGRYSCKREMVPLLCGFEFGLDQRREKVCLVGCLCLWFPLQRVDRPATVHLKIAQDSKNTDLKWSLITGTTRCSGNRSEIFQWAGEKSYKKSKNKYSQLHPHRTCFIFYSQGGIKTNKTSNSCILTSLQLYAIFMTLFLSIFG